MRKLALSAALAAVSTLSLLGAGGLPAGAAITTGSLINNPDYCLALYGDPSPCPPPDRPEPIKDRRCLRVDVAPLDCPYLP